jgi:REP element-mobilizing transposase RayT
LQKRPDVEMHDYIIMPNHVHLLFSTDKTLWAVVGGWKSAVSKHCHELWYHFARQPRYHDHIIRNEKEFEQIKRYIQNNPQKWEEDTFWVEI